MIKLSYKYKLLLSFTATFAVFAAVLVAFEMSHEQSYSARLLRERLQCYADLAAGIMERDTGKVATKKIEHFVTTLPDSAIRMTIMRHNGSVLYESEHNAPERMGNHADRPEVVEALTKTDGYDIRESATMKAEYFYYAKSYPHFIVRVALPYTPDIRNFLRPSSVFLWFVLIVFPIVIVMLIFLSDRMGKSISRLRTFISEAEKGRLPYVEIDFPHSELGEIGRKIMEAYKELDEKGREARDGRERLLKHFQYFEGGIAIFNDRREIIYANPRFTQYVNAILPNPTGDISTLWDDPAFSPALQYVELNSRAGRTPSGTAPVTRFTITSGGTHFSVQVLIYSEGDFEITMYDITHAEKNHVIKQQMSNNITHELRTPVSSIRGYIETIMECKGLSEEKKMYFLQRAHNQVLRLTELIRDVSIINKVEEAPETMTKEIIHPAEIMDDVLEELRAKIEEAGIKTESLIPQDTEVYGNYSLVYSIFRNLVENSVRYAGQGVTIHAECYKSGDDFCYFLFYDTGKGCPEKHLPRLFERFYRAEEGRTRELGGSGLGLSIVRNAVTFHHGNITVRNRKSGGLEFLFTLQRKPLQ